MGYSTLFDARKYRRIVHITEAILKLEDGEVYTFTHSDKRTLSRLRTLLYEWLHHQELKNNYTIRTTKTGIAVHRMRKVVFEEEEKPPSSVFSKEVPLTPTEDLILGKLFNMPEDEILNHLQEKVRKKKITIAGSFKVLAKYKEIMGV